MLTNPDLVGHLINKPEVVGDKDEASIELLDGVGQGINGLNIKMVSRLCEWGGTKKDQSRLKEST
jgi:hypothetical protein